MANAYMLAAVVTPAATINQISQQSIDPKISELLEAGDGKVDTEFAAIGESEPTLEFTTTALARALAVIGIDGYAVTSTDTVDFWLQKIAAGGTRSTSACLKLSALTTLCVPTNLEVSTGTKPGTLQVQCHTASADGTTVPWTLATAQTLPAPVLADQAYTVGPVYREGAAIDCIQSITVNFGIEVKMTKGDGGVYPLMVYIARRKPEIRVKTYDSSQFNNIGPSGVELTLPTKIFLRRIDEGGTRVGTGVASHIKLQVTKGIWVPAATSGDSESEQSTEFILRPRSDGTNPVIAVSTSSTIGAGA